MTEFPIKWSFEELQIKLAEQLMIRCNRKKRNKAKKYMMDSGNAYIVRSKTSCAVLSHCFTDCTCVLKGALEGARGSCNQLKNNRINY